MKLKKMASLLALLLAYSTIQAAIAETAPNVQTGNAATAAEHEDNDGIQTGVEKDLLIEQADIYTISPGGSNAAAASTAAHDSTARLPVTIWVNDRNNTYHIGDTITIYAKAQRDGYLTIIDVGTSGTIRQLYPNRFQPSNRIRKGDIIQIPAKNAEFLYRINGPTGSELLKAFVTDSPDSIYGKSATSFNDDVFPQSQTDSKTLSKDITIELNSNPRHQGWQSYNKIIYIRSGNAAAAHNSNAASQQQQYTSAHDERALRLNAGQIRDIQRRLRSEGYYRGRIDGIIGPGTRKALRTWQHANGLNASGYIDSITFTSLYI